jgi:hypothetical protein
VCQIEHSTAQYSRGEDNRGEAGQKSERIKVVKHLAEVLLDAQDIGPSTQDTHLSLWSVRLG